MVKGLLVDIFFFITMQDSFSEKPRKFLRQKAFIPLQCWCLQLHYGRKSWHVYVTGSSTWPSSTFDTKHNPLHLHFFFKFKIDRLNKAAQSSHFNAIWTISVFQDVNNPGRKFCLFPQKSIKSNQFSWLCFSLSNFTMIYSTSYACLLFIFTLLAQYLYYFLKSIHHNQSLQKSFVCFCPYQAEHSFNSSVSVTKSNPVTQTLFLCFITSTKSCDCLLLYLKQRYSAFSLSKKKKCHLPELVSNP